VTHIWGPEAASEEEEEESMASLVEVMVRASLHFLPSLNNGGNIDNDCLFLSVVLLIINIGSLFSSGSLNTA